MALSDGYLLKVQHRVDDKVVSFGVAYEVTSGSDVLTNSEFLCAAWFNTLLPLLTGCLAASVTWEGLYASCLVPQTALPDRLAGDSRVGDRDGDACPANMCCVVSLLTEDVTAQKPGRIYVSGFSKDDLADGLWESAFVAAQVAAFKDALAGDISESGTTFSPRIVQRRINGVDVGPFLLEVSATRTTQIPFTQRRRTTRQLGYVT